LFVAFFVVAGKVVDQERGDKMMTLQAAIANTNNIEKRSQSLFVVLFVVAGAVID